MSKSDPRPIGIFDSGLGGLTVAAELMRRLPRESIVYLGDTARVPYGNRSRETLLRYTQADAEFLRGRNVKLILAACNTVSAVALPVLKQSSPLPVYGVIEAGVKAATRRKYRSLLVIGTRGTISSGAYEQELKKLDPRLEISSVPCPLLAHLAEEGILSGPIVDNVLELYLGKFRLDPPDALLLGCTHYPLFRPALENFFRHQVEIIDSATSCADYIAEKLAGGTFLPAPDKAVPEHRFFVTDLTPGFQQISAHFFGSPLPLAQVISLRD